MRRGWPQSGPWEQCTSVSCPARGEHPDHAYAVVTGTGEAGDRFTLHLHAVADLDRHTVSLLHIETVPVP